MRDQSEQRGTLTYFLRRQALRPLPPYGRHGRIYLWRPLAIAGLIALVIGLGAGTSYAFVTKGRSETATAHLTVGSLKPITLATVGTPTSPLLPGRTGDVAFSITNPNHSPVSLIGVVLTGGASMTTDGDPECTTDGGPVVVLNVPPDDLPQSVPANTTKTIELANAASMNVTASNSCQGASFTLPLTVTVEP